MSAKGTLRRIVIAAGAALLLGSAGAAPAAPLPTGACCNSANGCCPEFGGSCLVTTAAGCFFGYQGDGTTCERPECEATTTTQEPTGACCLPDGNCDDDKTFETCNTGTFQGKGTTCGFVECTASTTTTTTTLPPLPECGDYNFDGKITAPDALGVLKAAVGTAKCVNEICDASGDEKITSTDALIVLKVAVGLPLKMLCPPFPT